MTWRILKGKRLSGSFGYDVSKTGFDVRTANIMQMAFTSDVPIPKLLIKGTIVAAPTSGPGPLSAGSVAGAEQTVSTVTFPRSVTTPAVIAVASAPAWTLPLVIGGSQLGYLANQWHTFISESPGALLDGAYGTNIQKTTTTQSTQVSTNWFAARFVCNGFSDHVDFITNCRNNVTIKYLIMEP